MADDLAVLSVRFEAQTKKLESELRRMHGTTDKVLKAVENRAAASGKAFSQKLGSGISAAAAAFKTFLGIAAVGALTQRTRAALDYADAIVDTADKLKIGVEALQEWRFAAQEAGGASADFDAALESFRSKIGGVLAELPRAQVTGSVLARLGLSAEDMREAGTTERQLLLIADALARISDPSVRAAIADRLGLAQLLPLLSQGSDRIDEFRQKAQAAGNVLGEKFAREAADAQREVQILTDKLNLNLNKALIDLGPALIWTTEKIAQLVAGFRDGANWAGQLSGIMAGWNFADGIIRGFPTGGTNAGGRMSPMSSGGASISDAIANADADANSWLRNSLAKYDLLAMQAKINASPDLPMSRISKGSGRAPPGMVPPKEPGGTSKAIVNEFEKSIADIRRRAEALAMETRLVGMSVFESERLRAALDLETSAREAGLTITAQMRAQIDESAAAYAREKVNLDETTEAHEARIEALQRAQEAEDQFRESIVGAASGGLQQFTDDLFDVAAGTKSVAEAFTDMANSILRDIARIMAQKFIIAPFEKWLDGALSGGDLLGNLFGSSKSSGGGGGFFSNIIGKRAGGGPVTAGMPYMVGERGPELVVPNRNATVIPALASAQIMGGLRARSAPNITIVQNIAANGDREIARIANKSVRDAAPMIVRAAAGEVRSQVQRSVTGQL